ncbi:MAG: hypothetical protein A2174_03020 [Candidatus Portnoybacteria bacterium RBG_13_41_18]|uniref:BioF2-like acetyltransferase domain-containing protein n=1 Tax=Candidatus Portnoybacteria bacterium RBG_13_41_18 TaxID=1801991 RepID=A0A1G2F8I5_9BACT|nr:MAG: hypothetical protein A2174_03020 [Candidatus Portnoybacteria bacterium RBG_13_41_18]
MINAFDANKENWNRFVVQHGGSFLQSYEWGEFQKSIGREVFYFKDINFQALVIKYQMPLGRNYLFCPHGPIIKSEIRNPKSETNSKLKCSNFINEVTNLAKREKSVFIRVEPMGDIRREELEELCFEKSKDIQPHKTLVLDLNLSEEELLAQMHEKTRYNIGLAARKGLTVRQTEYNEKDFEEFWRLVSITYKRQGIRSFSKEYYKKQLNFTPHPIPLLIQGEGMDHPSSVEEGYGGGGVQFRNILFLAEYKGKPIAANMVNIFGQRTTYLHGGSDNELRFLMAPHLLQWEQIKFAKNQSCKIYDFWGCDDERWPGVSRFKKGFGGREIEWCGTHDYVFDKFWYKIYKVGRSILR